jgi:hypothetical protein
MKKKRFEDNEIATAKQVSMIDYLAKKGFEPDYTRSGRAWYKSPLRSEKTASFSVSEKDNFFIDFGSCQSGDTIQLASHIRGVSFVDSVKHLIGGIEGNTFSFHCPSKYKDMPETVKLSTTLNNVKDFDTSKSITGYVVDQRGISKDIAKEYLKEYYFTLAGQTRQKFGVCLGANILGGFNINCGYKIDGHWFKSVIPSNAPNIIRNPDSNKWYIFEGLFDFLSWMTINKYSKHPFNIVVLNSVANIEKLGVLNESELLCYLDNDKAGKEAFQKLSTMYRCTDKSGQYGNHKDVNEYLISKRG